MEDKSGTHDKWYREANGVLKTIEKAITAIVKKVPRQFSHMSSVILRAIQPLDNCTNHQANTRKINLPSYSA